MKTKAERISNRNTNRHCSAALAPPAHRTPGETTHRLRTRNNVVATVFGIGASKRLGYTSNPVLGRGLAVGVQFVMETCAGLNFAFIAQIFQHSYSYIRTRHTA
ncbi:MAG: hypothetical protein WCC67_21215, partial [Candidatus Acidiferrales bacterium]